MAEISFKNLKLFSVSFCLVLFSAFNLFKMVTFFKNELIFESSLFSKVAINEPSNSILFPFLPTML